MELRQRDVIALFEGTDGGRRYTGELAHLVARQTAPRARVVNSLRNSRRNRLLDDGFRREVELGALADIQCQTAFFIRQSAIDVPEMIGHKLFSNASGSSPRLRDLMGGPRDDRIVVDLFIDDNDVPAIVGVAEYARTARRVAGAFRFVVEQHMVDLSPSSEALPSHRACRRRSLRRFKGAFNPQTEPVC